MVEDTVVQCYSLVFMKSWVVHAFLLFQFWNAKLFLFASELFILGCFV